MRPLPAAVLRLRLPWHRPALLAASLALAVLAAGLVGLRLLLAARRRRIVEAG
jgi:hypothetical protein